MNYVKKGILFTYKDLKLNYIKSHAMVPSPLKMKEGVYRIYFTSRNKKNQSLIFYFDLDIRDEVKIIKISKKPIFKPGLLGSFDDNGVTPCSFVRLNSKTVYMYYIGWKPRSTTRYSLMSGLAISNDNGITFKRYSRSTNN